MAQPDRRLVPIVSLDVVGYSRLAEINERQTLRLVQRVYDRLVARTIGRYGGKVFKTMGDGLLAEFQSVVAAVEWVSDMQTELYERRLRVPGGGYFNVRAGVVLADVLVAGDDLYGSGVNLSVRVQAISPPGGMAITNGCTNISMAAATCSSSTSGPSTSRTSPRPSASSSGTRMG